MPEAAHDPFPRMWERFSRTLGLNTEAKAPKGGWECIKHAIGVVPFVRGKIGGIMGLLNGRK